MVMRLDKKYFRGSSACPLVQSCNASACAIESKKRKTATDMDRERLQLLVKQKRRWATSCYGMRTPRM